MTTLKNTFHGTEYRTRKTAEEIAELQVKPEWEYTEAEKAFVRRAWNALCGIAGCTCGDALGIRN